MNGKYIKYISVLIIVSIIIFAVVTRDESETPLKDTPTVSNSAFIMDTFIQMQLYGTENPEVINKSFDRLREVENLFSKNIETSDVYRINNNAGQEVEVHANTIKIIQKAKEYSELTSGKFDVSIGPLLELWGIGTENPRVPREEEIEEAKAKVDYRNIEVNEEKQTVRIQENMKLDLPAIVKLGYSGSELREIIRDAEDLPAAFISLGGDVLVFGDKPDGSTWRIGIQDPRIQQYRGNLALAVELTGDNIITTSGNYERYFIEDGELYHHIFDPDTGRPVQNNLRSVTLITDNSFDADVFATSLYIMGLEKGMEFVKNHLENTEAIFITDDLKAIATAGLDGKLEVLNEDFEILFE
ncbi:FAD:protein FMN transferase [Natronospora cellulosivora (SeqCode)]